MSVIAPQITLLAMNDVDAAGVFNAGIVKAGNLSSNLVAGDPTGSDAGIYEVHVWNNHNGAGLTAAGGTAGTDSVADMIECSVTALGEGGATNKEIVGWDGSENVGANMWIEARLNDAVIDGTTDAAFVKIGPNHDLPIRSVAKDATNVVTYTKNVATGLVSATPVNTGTYDPTVDDVISGTNASTSETMGNTTDNAAKLVFRVNVPATASPGKHGFRIRVQGYYV